MREVVYIGSYDQETVDAFERLLAATAEYETDPCPVGSACVAAAAVEFRRARNDGADVARLDLDEADPAAAMEWTELVAKTIALLANRLPGDPVVWLETLATHARITAQQHVLVGANLGGMVPGTAPRRPEATCRFSEYCPRFID